MSLAGSSSRSYSPTAEVNDSSDTRAMRGDESLEPRCLADAIATERSPRYGLRAAPHMFRQLEFIPGIKSRRLAQIHRRVPASKEPVLASLTEPSLWDVAIWTLSRSGYEIDSSCLARGWTSEYTPPPVSWTPGRPCTQPRQEPDNYVGGGPPAVVHRHHRLRSIHLLVAERLIGSKPDTGRPPDSNSANEAPRIASLGYACNRSIARQRCATSGGLGRPGLAAWRDAGMAVPGCPSSPPRLRPCLKRLPPRADGDGPREDHAAAQSTPVTWIAQSRLPRVAPA